MKTSTKGLEFMHFRSEAYMQRGATVAIFPQPEMKRALISVARTAPHDTFSRKIGRDVSAGRIQAYLAGRPGMAQYVRVIDVPETFDLKAVVADELEEEMDSYLYD
jgi:hypothetical protein